MEEFIKNHPKLKGLDPLKLQFLTEFAQKGKPNSTGEVLPFLMANLNAAKQKNINFSDTEIQLIITLLSQNLSPEEQKKVQKILKLMGKSI